MSPEELKILIITVAASIMLVFALVLVICAYIPYKKVFRRPRRTRDPYSGLDAPKYAPYADVLRRMISDISAEKYESVSITAKDGTKLVGRYYHRQDGAPIHLIVHGYKSSPLRDGAGGGCDSREMGHNLLLVHQRAHGESAGKTISFGIRERYDVISWCEYLTERFGNGCEIILIGVSMGAASSIMAAGLGLPPSVKCVIADCPYSSPREVLIIGAARQGRRSSLVYPMLKLGAALFGRFSVTTASPEEAIKHSKLPVLIMHGECDSVAPVEMSVKIADAARSAGVDCTLEIFEGAEHCLAFAKDHARYAKIRDEFLKKHVRGMTGGADHKDKI